MVEQPGGWRIFPNGGGGAAAAGTGIFAFSDRRYGWLSLDVQGNTLFAASDLLRTSDGGKTWNWVKGEPDGEITGILALDERDVWMPTLSMGVSDLNVSRDGGNSFQKASLPAPKEVPSEDDPSYELPVFSDRLHGYEAVTYSGLNSAAVLFATQDSGRTWRRDRILLNLGEMSAGEASTSTVAGSVWVFSFGPKSNQPAMMKLLPKSGVTDGSRLRLNDYSCSLSFATPGHGWRICDRALYSTTDGGTTWTDITPRVRNGVLTDDPVRAEIIRTPAGDSAPRR
jgi:photosystem II stability/assembly factor-like uncharacterized protein